MAFLLLCLSNIAGYCADPYPRNEALDVIHYTFRVEINDTTNVIDGQADITISFREAVKEFQLNLINKNADGRGMQVFSVTSSGKPLKYHHTDNQVTIHADGKYQAGDTVTFAVNYRGEPIDGLVIGKNKFGDRTFFGDNWPDRGHHWLPTIDHPSDKAKVDFIITAPDHYEIVATGRLVSERGLPRNRKEHHWTEGSNVAIKVVTFGAAEFSVQQTEVINGVPISTWVFPQNEKPGFDDFSVAPKAFQFMQEYVGPYPYEKLAHVQSKTRFGGLENASNIFYFENSVDGKREREGLIAHETAHQWFGNSLTEKDWYHVWLSEGFATYFAALYLGTRYGEQRLAKEMREARTDVIKSTRKKPGAIIDTTILDINEVLNTNTYQKASWFLHMLRLRVGPETFQSAIREFYHTYRDGNVMTADFLAVMERVSKQDLEEFFGKWLYQPGLPQLTGNWSYIKKSKTLTLHIESSEFPVPAGTIIDIALTFDDGTRQILGYSLAPGEKGVTLKTARRPASIVLDPDTKLLFEGEIREKR